MAQGKRNRISFLLGRVGWTACQKRNISQADPGFEILDQSWINNLPSSIPVCSANIYQWLPKNDVHT